MSNKIYPPIPGVVGKRGRPSREEMERRKAYWDAQGGAPVSTKEEDASTSSEPSMEVSSQLRADDVVDSSFATVPASPERVKEILSSLVEATRPAITLPRQNSTAKNQDVIKIVQEIIKTKLSFELTDQDENRLEAILSELPVSKQGRPSNSDLAAKQLVHKKVKEYVVDRLREEAARGNTTMEEEKQIESKFGLAEASMATSQAAIQTSKSNRTTIPPAPIGLGGHPQYKYGDGVSLTSNPDQKGIILRHDVNKLWAYVQWKNGVKDWRHVESLNGFRPKNMSEILGEEDKFDTKEATA